MSRESCRMSGGPQARESLGDAYRWYREGLSIRRWNKGMEGGDGGFEALEETLEASPQAVDRA